MYVVTGATGQLGQLVIQSLLKKVPANQIVAAVRNPEKAKALAARGVQVRLADYDRPESLAAAFAGATRLLLISANEIGKRERQHTAAIDAARAAKVPFVAYTSILKADSSTISLAGEHLATEKAIRASGIPFTFLRNGWYLENYTGQVGTALQHGLVGSAKNGKIAAAARADFAEAAVAVLTGQGHENKVYELAGDDPFTMPELAAEIAKQAGKPVAYADVPPEKYQQILLGVGLPEPVATMLVSADVGISRGELDGSSADFRKLIGRPTTPLADAVRAALKS